jgi:nicotinamidase-related amidase
MAFELDSKTTALVLIDLQYGVIGRQLAPHDAGDVIKRSASLAHGLREKGSPIVYVRVLVGEMLNLPVDQSWPRGTGELPPNVSEIVAEAGIQPGDYVVAKRQWGAFYGTELEQILRRRCVKTIVLCGIATNYGVESTARAAFDQGFELVFAEDATSSVSEESHRFAIDNIFPRMGRVRSVDEILSSLTYGLP